MMIVPVYLRFYLRFDLRFDLRLTAGSHEVRAKFTEDDFIHVIESTPVSQPRDTVSQPMHIIRCILECKAMTCIETCYKDTYSEDDKDGSHDDIPC